MNPPDKSVRQVSLLLLFSPDEETEAFTRLSIARKNREEVVEPEPQHRCALSQVPQIFLTSMLLPLEIMK